MEFDGAVDRVISMVPDIADKLGDLFKKLSKKKDEKEVVLKEEKTTVEGTTADYSEAAEVEDF